MTREQFAVELIRFGEKVEEESVDVSTGVFMLACMFMLGDTYLRVFIAVASEVAEMLMHDSGVEMLQEIIRLAKGREHAERESTVGGASAREAVPDEEARDHA